MNNSTTISRDKAIAGTTVSTELNKVGTIAFAFSAAVIGCWAMVALFAGTVSSGGPLGLLRTLVTTITG